MFVVKCKDIEAILKDYRVAGKVKGFSELQRYNYESGEPNSKEVRLIVRVDLENARPLVMRFKNEENVSAELIESQCRFAETLRQNGIITPEQYKANGRFANEYCIGGYDVVVTVEQFAENEIKLVNEAVAEKTGELLGRMHAVSERNDLHVENAVLFNPFERNDLFDYEGFLSVGDSLTEEAKAVFDDITRLYHAYMEVLAPLRQLPKCAVQGDISECNLYLTPAGEVGVFDFNRAGDNILFCDAVMQAVFEARLMDYPEDAGDGYETLILRSFLKGYGAVRQFSEQERQWFPYLYAIINAFWSADIRWAEDSLLSAHKAGNTEAVRRWLTEIHRRLLVLLKEKDTLPGKSG